MRWTFEQHLSYALENAGNNFSPAVVVKEMLHFDLLRALSGCELGDSLVFQGGTALRLCHNGDRLSEDLDFVCGAGNAEPLVIEPMVEILRRQMTERYGLEVENVKGPKGQALTTRAQVKRWEFVIRVPIEGRAQKIRVEICNVPAYDAGPVLVRPTYPQLEQLEPIVLRVESQHEIMADKLLALAAREHTKNRDVWDLKLLVDRGIEPDIELVRRKAEDYGLSKTKLQQGLNNAIARLTADDAHKNFIAEMSRFVSLPMAEKLERHPELGAAWLDNAIQLATRLRE